MHIFVPGSVLQRLREFVSLSFSMKVDDCDVVPGKSDTVYKKFVKYEYYLDVLFVDIDGHHLFVGTFLYVRTILFYCTHSYSIVYQTHTHTLYYTRISYISCVLIRSTVLDTIIYCTVLCFAGLTMLCFN